MVFLTFRLRQRRTQTISRAGSPFRWRAPNKRLETNTWRFVGIYSGTRTWGKLTYKTLIGKDKIAYRLVVCVSYSWKQTCFLFIIRWWGILSAKLQSAGYRQTNLCCCCFFVFFCVYFLFLFSRRLLFFIFARDELNKFVHIYRIVYNIICAAVITGHTRPQSWCFSSGKCAAAALTYAVFSSFRYCLLSTCFCRSCLLQGRNSWNIRRAAAAKLFERENKTKKMTRQQFAWQTTTMLNSTAVWWTLTTTWFLLYHSVHFHKWVRTFLSPSSVHSSYSITSKHNSRK